MRNANEAMFRIRVEGVPDGELRVLRLRGEEGISELFRFDLELVSENPAIDFSMLVGRAAAIEIAGPIADRYVNGIVARFEQSAIGKRFTKYFAQIVPRFFKLLHREDSRIFQGTTVPDIVKQVFAAAGIPEKAYRPVLKATYPEREYCVQYQESDWAFVSRLLEEEGILYFFEHTADEHLLVLGDDPSAHTDIATEPAVLFRDPTGFVPESEYVGTFRYAQSVRTGAYALRDYNFEKPSTNLESRDSGDLDGDLETFEYPGRYRTSEDGRRLATVRLGERQALRHVGVGHSVCRRLIPGYRFNLTEHQREDFNAPYLVTDLAHDGYEPQALEQEMPQNETETEYTNEFRCIGASVPYRPLRSTPRPVIQGPQPAVVVGPKGEEIYTDPHGRIKVQFFWDRRGQANENSSCWVRVAQPWAGQGFGSMFLPRIGWEVLVTFLNGDPDQPVIVGSLYNASQTPPYLLPDQKTVSALKSASTPGAGGFNEIRFEDKQGAEQLFIHAQKNMDARIGEDRYELVGRDAHVVVKQDHVTNVQHERHTKVVADDITEVGKDLHLNVKGKQALEITGSSSLTVTGDVIEVFKANHSEQVTQSYYVKAMGVVIEAMTGITLKCGGSNIVIDASGVTVKGPMVTIDGAMIRIASGPGSPAMSGSAGSAVSPIAPKEALEADEADPGKVAEARAQQSQIQSGKYGAARIVPFKPSAEDLTNPEKTWVEIELVDEEGNPVAGERYAVTLADGTTVAQGTLDQNGFARIEGIDPGTCKVTFPRLDKDAWEPA